MEDKGSKNVLATENVIQPDALVRKQKITAIVTATQTIHLARTRASKV
jgi:hypothetical protein